MPPTQPVKAARGTRDILPAERAAWAVVERAARDVARAYGYQEIETPLVERVELIERGVGNETDIVSKELFRLVRRGDEDLVLRPEGTAGILRAYFQHHLDQAPQPVRLFTLGSMFRYDRPQTGRYRQFHQFDLEAIGDASPALDAEVIAMAMDWMEGVGLGRLLLQLNSIGDRNCRPAYLEALVAHYRPRAAELCPQCRRRLETNPLRLLDCKEAQCEPVKAGAPKLLDHLCDGCAAAFAQVRRLLDSAGVEYVLDPHLVRGLDYYTRTVFEIQHEGLGGAQNSLGGGGRYDALAATVGYPDTPAVGFAGGIERVVMMMAAEGEQVVAPAAAELVVLPAEPELDVEAWQVGAIGRSVLPTQVDCSARSLKARMRAANKIGPRWVAIFNREEAQRRVVQLKELASGEQREVGWDQLAGVLAEGAAPDGRPR